MADSVVSYCVSSHILPKNRGNTNEYVCNKCSVYESQLKEALDELGSARRIIDILQKEFLTSTATRNTQDNNLAQTEGFMNSNPRKKKIKSHKCENDNLLMLQQFQPISVLVNRYAPLDNLQDNTEAFP
jgi:predicted nucleic-acid-binding Zn-ribbon protein